MPSARMSAPSAAPPVVAPATCASVSTSGLASDHTAPVESGIAAPLRYEYAIAWKPSLNTAMFGAATSETRTSPMNDAVMSCTFVVGWAVCHAVMIGSAATRSAESMTNGPPRYLAATTAVPVCRSLPVPVKSEPFCALPVSTTQLTGTLARKSACTSPKASSVPLSWNAVSIGITSEPARKVCTSALRAGVAPTWGCSVEQPADSATANSNENRNGQPAHVRRIQPLGMFSAASL